MSKLLMFYNVCYPYGKLEQISIYAHEEREGFIEFSFQGFSNEKMKCDSHEAGAYICKEVSRQLGDDEYKIIDISAICKWANSLYGEGVEKND